MTDAARRQTVVLRLLEATAEGTGGASRGRRIAGGDGTLQPGRCFSPSTKRTLYFVFLARSVSGVCILLRSFTQKRKRVVFGQLRAIQAGAPPGTYVCVGGAPTPAGGGWSLATTPGLLMAVLATAGVNGERADRVSSNFVKNGRSGGGFLGGGEEAELTGLPFHPGCNLNLFTLSTAGSTCFTAACAFSELGRRRLGRWSVFCWSAMIDGRLDSPPRVSYVFVAGCARSS